MAHSPAVRAESITAHVLVSVGQLSHAAAATTVSQQLVGSGGVCHGAPPARGSPGPHVGASFTNMLAGDSKLRQEA